MLLNYKFCHYIWGARGVHVCVCVRETETETAFKPGSDVSTALKDISVPIFTTEFNFVHVDLHLEVLSIY